jgi:glycerophosphoryl diester phosphodiesterase
VSRLSCPLITAHTGCEGTPDNSLISIEAALASGADVVEIDVRASADGHPVLHHDSTFRDGTGEEIRIAQRSRMDLDERFRAAGSPPVELNEVLQRIARQDVMLNIDLKDVDGVRELWRQIEDFGLHRSVIFTGCDADGARLVSSIVPGARVLLNIADDEMPDSEEDYQDAVHRICSIAAAAGCCGLNVDHRQCRPSLVAIATRRFLPVSVWTVDHPEDMRRMYGMGVYAITTRYPALLGTVLSGGAA